MKKIYDKESILEFRVYTIEVNTHYDRIYNREYISWIIFNKQTTK